MARLANFNGVSETLPGIAKFPSIRRRTQKRVKTIKFLCKKTNDDSQQQQEHSPQTTRRLALGLASMTLVGNTCSGVSLAEGNGFWITGPLPVPSVYNSKHFLFPVQYPRLA